MSTNSISLTGQQLLESSAGTGKTYTITHLYLRLLLGRGRPEAKPLKVQEILVLTFTIAATQELKDRIRTLIATARNAFQAGQSEDPDLQNLMQESDDLRRDQLLLTDAIQWLDDAAIHTIHGFCARMLAENSFQAGILFDQDLDADKAALLNLAVEDIYRRDILTLPTLERAIALRVWPDPKRLRKSLEPLLYRHNLLLLPEAKPAATLPVSLTEKMLSAKRLWLKEDLSTLLRSSGVKKNLSAYRSLDKMDYFCGDHEDLDPESKLWTYWAQQNLAAAMKKGLPVPVHPCLDLLTDIQAELSNLDVIKVRLWHQILQAVRDHLEHHKTSSAQLTVDDLLIQMQTATRLNPRWCEQLSRDFPAILVDEFQDTDDIQYEVFRNIHRSREDHLLLLIGDPKQAIYQFRGADVYTYILAKRESDDQYNLNTNYRSSSLLVETINHLFDQPDIFGNQHDIAFSRSIASDTAQQKNLTINDQTILPLEIYIPHDPDRPLLQAQGLDLSMAYAAEKICHILNFEENHQMLIDGKSIQAGQIALLTRSRREARAARQALAERRIASVFLTQDSVLLEQTAADLILLLQGIITPLQERHLLSAMSCQLIQSSMLQIQGYREDQHQQTSIMLEFQQYQAIWKQQGIAAMIHELIRQRQLAEIWLGEPEGERQLTNLRHLAEILQLQALESDGMQPLLNWFIKARHAELDRPADNRQLRLESDENLVKIVTMHGAKGLEYDIVVVPIGSFSSQTRQNSNYPALFHQEDEQGRIQVCAELGQNDAHRKAAIQESREEDMRLLYVALTRAKSRCLIGLPIVRGFQNTAMARLLGLSQAKLDAEQVQQHLENSLEGMATVKKVQSVARSQLIQSQPRSAVIPPKPMPLIQDQWQIHSYTGITRTLEHRQGNRELPQGFNDDDPPTASPLYQSQSDLSRQNGEVFTSQGPDNDGYNRFNFDRGPRIGVALHSLLEKINFQASPEALNRACQQLLQQLDLKPDQWLKPTLVWLQDMLATPLSNSAFSLQDIADFDRLDELEFHFPVSSGQALISVCQHHGYLQGYHAETLALEGMMTGKIDLICRYKGQYYIIDYKSNFLGYRQTDYAETALSNSILQHQYDLQYLIYSVALKKFLSSRLPGKDFETLYGGIYYLFLRGMNGKPGSGVFTDRPSMALLRALELVLEPEAC